MGDGKRVHTREIHQRERFIVEGIKVEGFYYPCIFGFAVIIGKVLLTEPCRAEALNVFGRIEEEVSLAEMTVFFAVNILRWMAVYLIRVFHAKGKKIKNIFLALALPLLMEVPVGTTSGRGCVGMMVRYVSLLQMLKSMSYVLAETEFMEMEDVPEAKRGGQLREMLSFVAYPTLCYQRAYPTKKRSPKSVLFYLLLFPISMCSMQYLLFDRALPAAKAFIEQPSLKGYVDLIIFTNGGWISGFLFILVGAMGLFSEVSGFGDCHFFSEWWNTGVRGYWRCWNTQVHMWIKRHMYIPIRRGNVSRGVSQAIVFFVSSVTHEYIIRDGLGNRGVGFISMISQSPLVILSEAFAKAFDVNESVVSIVLLNLIGAPLLAVFSQWKE